MPAQQFEEDKENFLPIQKVHAPVASLLSPTKMRHSSIASLSPLKPTQSPVAERTKTPSYEDGEKHADARLALYDDMCNAQPLDASVSPVLSASMEEMLQVCRNIATELDTQKSPRRKPVVSLMPSTDTAPAVSPKKKPSTNGILKPSSHHTSEKPARPQARRTISFEESKPAISTEELKKLQQSHHELRINSLALQSELQAEKKQHSKDVEELSRKNSKLKKQAHEYKKEVEKMRADILETKALNTLLMKQQQQQEAEQKSVMESLSGLFNKLQEFSNVQKMHAENPNSLWEQVVDRSNSKIDSFLVEANSLANKESNPISKLYIELLAESAKKQQTMNEFSKQYVTLLNEKSNMILAAMSLKRPSSSEDRPRSNPKRIKNSHKRTHL